MPTPTRRDIACFDMASAQRDKNDRRGPNPGTASLDIENVMVAFSEEQVERITKLTKRRLRYWAASGFFKPSYVEAEEKFAFSRFYSFKDIVALRTLEKLRVQNNVPLQHLRKVAERLSHLADRLWTETILFVINRKVVIVKPDSPHPEDVLTGQFVLKIPLQDIISDIKDDVLALRSRSPAAFGRLSKHRGVIRNALVVAGTRVPVISIVRLHEDGYSDEQIIAEYPDLTKADIEAALERVGSKVA